jgi:hypothetical protein
MLVDAWWTSTPSERVGGNSEHTGNPCKRPNSSGWIRTIDLTIMSRAL